MTMECASGVGACRSRPLIMVYCLLLFGCGLILVYVLPFKNLSGIVQIRKQEKITQRPVSNESEPAFGLNILESRIYHHHPIMRLLSTKPVRLHPKYLVEPNGLLIPAHYDCNIFNNNKKWGNMGYFRASPARWYPCWYHYANVQSGMPNVIPQLPIIDEEYFEHVAILDSVVRARDRYIIAEIGARWGTWGARAIKFLKRVNPIPYSVLFVEALKLHCDAVDEVMKLNDIEYTLDCDYATPEKFVEWASRQPHIDILDLDIQSAEYKFFKGEKVREVVRDKVHRLIVGTHSETIHSWFENEFKDWHTVTSVPMNTMTSCISKNFRANDKSNRVIFDRVIEEGCFHETIYGKICNWDGELILDNPRFYNGSTLFANKVEYEE